MRPPLLILFDIDGTLLLSQGAGAKAMQEAGKRVVGLHYDLSKVSFAGRLDPLIWADGAALAGVEDPVALEPAFRKSYRSSLLRRLSTTDQATMLEGVEELLAPLRVWDGVTLGLLTGNYPETGTMKMETAGIPMYYFPIRAWGCDGPSRRALPRVAMERYREWVEHDVDPSRVVIIGDTPADIDCAHHNGCRAIAVASGPSYSLEELEACSPDLALEDLLDRERIIDFLTEVKYG